MKENETPSEEQVDEPVVPNEPTDPPEGDPEIDPVDLMLHGNLPAQIRYAMIKGVADALDEKAQLLLEAESNFEPQEDETFAEIALPEIEAMAQALTEDWIDFSRLRYWETCQTAEIEWEEYPGEDGQPGQRVPTPAPWKMPRMGTGCLPTWNRPEPGSSRCTTCTSKREWAGYRPMAVRRMASTLMTAGVYASRN